MGIQRATGTEDAIEGPASGDQFISRFGGDDDLDQPIEHRVSDARPILRPFGRCRLRAEIWTQRNLQA